MRILLDTHLLLWLLSGSPRMPREAKRLVQDVANEVFFSAASVWEVAIKRGLRRNDFVVEPGRLAETLSRAGLGELAVSAAHAARVASLPAIHRDPFDRLLVAQALAEPMTLLTNDAMLADYGGIVQVV